MNNKGKGSGLALVLILLVALLIAFLAVKNFTALNTVSAPGVEQTGDPVQQAQSLVDQINLLQQQAGKEP